MKRLFSYNFPTPSYLAMNSFAIDISDQSIKYGELVPTASGLRLGRYGKEKISEGIVVSGMIEKPDELVKILKSLKEREKMHFIRVSLPEEQMYLFSLHLPKTNAKDIRDTILLQIEEHIPLKASDVVFDYDIVLEKEASTVVEVVAMASNTVDGYLSIFDRAGLVPLSFELEAQAITRAVIPAGDMDPVMVVDFGDSRTGVSISNNGRVCLTTTLSFGGLDLTKMIAKNFSLSFEEAQRMKHEYGLDKVVDAEKIFPAILNGISVLRDELNKQLFYWDTHDHDKDEKTQQKISRIVLCGGDANLAGLSEYLELSMKIKVENANVWVNILNTKDVVPEMTLEESLSYATVVGLTLGGYMYGPQSIINILPCQEKKILKKEYWQRFVAVFINLITILGALTIILLFPSYFLSNTRESMAEEQLRVFNEENPSLTTENIDKVKNDINIKLNTLAKSETPYQFNEKVLDNVLSHKISGVTFSQILFSKNGSDTQMLEIRGIAKNRDSLRNLKTALDNDPNFSNVELPVSNFLEKEDLNFDISILIK